MCTSNLMNSMLQSGEMLGVIKRLDPKFAKEFDAKSNIKSTPTFSKKTDDVKRKQKRFLKVSSSGSASARRSFLS